VFHASATAAGLNTAIGCAGDEARVVEASWYGNERVELGLGAAFHSRRLTLMSSQVGRVAPAMRSRWTHARRLAKALSLLADPLPDVLLAPPVAFEQLPQCFASLLDGRDCAPCPIVAYPPAADLRGAPPVPMS
jgi:hypothetical protein